MMPLKFQEEFLSMENPIHPVAVIDALLFQLLHAISTFILKQQDIKKL